MSSSASGLRAPRDVNSEGWEVATFPLVCETCLGDNPYLRMIRNHAGKECNVCQRPYTAFRWQPGRKARYKNTVICQTCARLKNVCQVCLFDLQFGLPVQLRDKYLLADDRVVLPQSQVNRDYMVNKFDFSSLPYGKLDGEGAGRLAGASSAGVPAGRPWGLRDDTSGTPLVPRSRPYYQRNEAKTCTFWLRGACTRGDACPYAHKKRYENGIGGSSIREAIRTRFHGNEEDDAEAKEGAGKLEGEEMSGGPPAPPDDAPLPPPPA